MEDISPAASLNSIITAYRPAAARAHATEVRAGNAQKCARQERLRVNNVANNKNEEGETAEQYAQRTTRPEAFERGVNAGAHAHIYNE